MKVNKVVISVLAVVVVLVGMRLVLGASNAGTDQQQIEAALKESIQASKEGRPGGVLDKLSAKFTVNDLDTGGNRSQIAEFIKNNKPDVTIDNTKAVVTGDEARIVSPVRLEMNVLGQTMSRDIREVTFIFRKEDGTRYLVIPVRSWKLAEVEVPEAVISEFLAG